MVAPDHLGAGVVITTRHDGLDEISELLEVDRHELSDWDESHARLYAIDCASIVYRYQSPELDETARDIVQRLLHQAMQLVTAGRESELASIERALMTGLEAASLITRSVWLVALNSLLPDAFRAAVVSTEASLMAFGRGPNPRRDAVAESVRRRVVSRTEEASLLGMTRVGRHAPYAVA